MSAAASCPDTTLELIRLIYGAVSDASSWQAFLEALVRATGGRGGSLGLFLPDVGAAVSCWSGWSDDDIRIYNERYAAIDPWGVAANRMQEGEVVTSLDLCSENEFIKSVVYREYYARIGCYYGFGCCILRREAGLSAVSIGRAKEAGPFKEAEISILRPLVPHLQQAALLHGELSSLRRQLTAFTGHLDRYPHPFLLLDSRCQLLYRNAPAHEIIRRADGLSLEDGRLSASSLKQTAALKQAVEEISKSAAMLRRIDIRISAGRAPFRLLLMGVPQMGAIPLGVAQPSVAVVIIDSESGPEPDPNVLGEMFSLTPAEARVTAKLAHGLSVEEIAGAMDISIETVRTHLKRVLSKTGTGRQGELISLVLRTSPFHRI